jgi:uncharacterized membrane protein
MLYCSGVWVWPLVAVRSAMLQYVTITGTVFGVACNRRRLNLRGFSPANVWVEAGVSLLCERVLQNG